MAESPNLQSSSGTSSDVERTGPVSFSENIELYHTGLAIRNAMLQQPGWSITWPPGSDMISLDECAKLIPFQLFNLLALMLHATDGIPQQHSFVDVSDEQRMKIISICMDILSQSSDGRKQNPKSLVLGLALRHITGSTLASNLVHKFGHCAFSPFMFTIVVWDNIDREEETSSGKGTTHHTNDILIQPSVSQADNLPHSSSISRIQRTLTPATSSLPGYKLVSRIRPPNIPSEINLASSAIKTPRVVMDQRKDFAFISMKALSGNTSHLPVWTGFNQLLHNTLTLQKSAIHYLPACQGGKYPVFCQLGKSFDFEENLVDDLEQFICKAYRSTASTLDQARYQLFCMGSKGEAQLPPTRDALKQHIKRANYQACIWRICLDSQPLIPSPIGHLEMMGHWIMFG